MVDTVDVKTLFNGIKYKVFHLVNRSDGTGEVAVQKVDISTFTDPTGKPATYSVIDRIDYSVGVGRVDLLWDHTTDDEIATLTGQGCMDWSQTGGNVDPRSAGDTGDIMLTASGFAATGSGYDITLYVRMKA